MKNLIRAAITGITILVSATFAQALTFDYTRVLTGATPGGTLPWLTAELTDSSLVINGISTSGVLLNLTARGLLPSEFVTKWTFNSTLNDLSGLSAVVTGATSGIQLISETYDLDKVNAGGAGSAKLDIGFLFQTSNNDPNRFQAGDIASLFLYGASGLTAETFNTTNEDKHEYGYYAAAHIQGIGENADFSSWVVPGSMPVPEPATLILLGSGFLGLTIYGRRRKTS